MEELKIDKLDFGSSLDTMKISGMSEEELKDLRRVPHDVALDRLLEMLDKRNNGLGTRWACGRGVYSFWFDNVAAYVNIGRSCD